MFGIYKTVNKNTTKSGALQKRHENWRILSKDLYHILDAVVVNVHFFCFSVTHGILAAHRNLMGQAAIQVYPLHIPIRNRIPPSFHQCVVWFISSHQIRGVCIRIDQRYGASQSWKSLAPRKSWIQNSFGPPEKNWLPSLKLTYSPQKTKAETQKERMISQPPISRW